jgi:DNA modification methylase
MSKKIKSNVVNRTIFVKDNYDVLSGLNSESVDLIYLDPPFNSKANYQAPVGSTAEGAEFKDIFGEDDLKDEQIGLLADKHPKLASYLEAIRVISSKSNYCYLTYMAIRLIEMQRVLKSTGSIYLHCDDTMSHYLKAVMDAIFGEKNYRNEISWQRANGSKGTKKAFARNRDIILFYSKSEKYTFNTQYTPLSQDTVEKFYKYIDSDGRRYGKGPLDNPHNGGYSYVYKGYQPPAKGWRCPESTMKQLDKDGLLVFPKDKAGRITKKLFFSDTKGVALSNNWSDITCLRRTSKELVGYPTQKPLDLLARIINASSNEGDVVLDPFCGCATSSVSAELLGRQWIGIDISIKAHQLVKQRLKNEIANNLLTYHNGKVPDVVLCKDAPIRTDLGNLDKKYNHPENKHFLYGKQEGRCCGCNTHFEFRNLAVDHIKPQAKGGTDHLSNLQLLCSSCNSIKGARDMAYLKKELKARGYLNS